MDNTIDTNIDNYTYEDLLEIIGLDESTNKALILIRLNKIIEKYKADNNETLYNFFISVKEKIINEEAEEKNNLKQEREFLSQQYADQPNKNQNSKITDRHQQIQVLTTGNHPVMDRQRLGVENTIPLELGQDYINPTLRQEYHKYITVDSQFRPHADGPYDPDPDSKTSTTNYKVFLSEILKRCNALQLHSIFIPKCWYVFDDNLHNTFFDISGGGNLISIKIHKGNYNANGLMDEINAQIQETIIFSLLSLKKIDNISDTIYYFQNNSGSPLSIIFYKQTNDNNMKYQQCLGYMLGYRILHQTNSNGTQIKDLIIDLPDAKSNVAQTCPNLIGSQYFRLIINEYNTNRVNNTEVSILKNQIKIPLPGYAGEVLTNSDNINDNIFFPDPNNPFNTKNQISYKPSNPRKLTKAQLYSINEIINNYYVIDNSLKAPNNPDIFAIINLTENHHQSFISISNSTLNNRIYFGPIDIEKISIRLEDDKGNTVNLHGSNWSFVIKATHLFQY